MTHGGRKKLPTSEVLILGSGIIGLSIALELDRRDWQVTVADRFEPMTGASVAAAGMLAAEDPHNPPEILAFARRSLALYPDWLESLEARSGEAVPFQTSRTWQYSADGSRMLLEEHSVDPRMLAASLLAAVRAPGNPIRMLPAPNAQEDTIANARIVIYATGAWQPPSMPLRPGSALPRKGQMLRVSIPSDLTLDEVHRSEEVYVVPRTTGPQAGTALIGATVEDAGFDKSVHPADLDHLRRLASRFFPQFASTGEAPLVESWAGLRPSTPDGLPIIGHLAAAGFYPGTQHLIATGHYRNGILLAPATAEAIADLLEDRPPAVPLEAFNPDRFA